MEKYFISVRFANKFIKISKESKEADFNYLYDVRYVCELLTLLWNHMYHAAGIKIAERKKKLKIRLKEFMVSKRTLDIKIVPMLVGVGRSENLGWQIVMWWA